MTVLLSLLWGLAAAGIACYCCLVTRRITYVTLADGRRQERMLPWMFRLLLPLVPNVEPLVKTVFEKSLQKTEKRLVSAGFEGLLSGAEFISLRVLLPAVLGPVWVAVMLGLGSSSRVGLLRDMTPTLCIVGPLWLCAYPGFWLSRVLRARHRSMQRALPFVLDLLTLSVEAGTDFMNALQRGMERRAVDPLGEELLRVIREIQIGKTRREALRDMSLRVNQPDLRSVVNALVQADELGVSIGSMLRIQAEQMRQRRFERAEKLANEAPVKLLFPLVFLIFPAVFLVLLGPILYSVRQSF